MNEINENINNETYDTSIHSSTPTLKKYKKKIKDENKELKPKKKKEKIIEEKQTIFTHVEYFKDIQNIITSYKICELKQICRYNQIIIGKNKNKNDIIDKINDFYNKVLKTIIIQKYCRGFFVRLFFKNKNVKSANIVNETDFYTLEPLNDINIKELIYMIDNDNFTYGFNINSLITLYKKNGLGNIVNPYTRQIFTLESVQNLFCHYQLLRLLFKENVLEDDKIPYNINYTYIPKRHHIHYQYMFKSRQLQQLQQQIENNEHEIQDNENNEEHERQPTLLEQNMQETTPTLNEMSNIAVIEINQPNAIERLRFRMNEIRRQPLNTRINEIFMEIDRLGNYTNSSWFVNLNKDNYYVFYNQLYEIWGFRGQIPFITKYNICPLGDPFYETTAIFRTRYDDLTREQLCDFCVNVMENIIMTAFDVEFQKLGCLHVLTALTVVSIPARIQYEYLYDSLY